MLLDRARTAVEQVDSPLARSTFPKELDPPYGSFYCSWSLYLRAEYIRAAGTDGDSAYILAEFERDCAEFAGALDRSPTPFLPSYPDAAWPVDTCVGIAALSIRDRIFGSKYQGLVERWVESARLRVDPKLHALSHAADPATGAPQMGVRGGSLALMSRVLAEAAPDLAREQFAVLKRRFVAYTWGVPGVREYPHGTIGPADVDSGPLFLGFSGSAIAVGAGAARIHGDESLARALLETVEVSGLPIEWRGSRRYLLGAVPVGEAFIAWARSTAPLPESGLTHWKRTIPTWWAFPAHVLSLAVAVILILPLYRFWRKRELGQGRRFPEAG